MTQMIGEFPHAASVQATPVEPRGNIAQKSTVTHKIRTLSRLGRRRRRRRTWLTCIAPEISRWHRRLRVFMPWWLPVASGRLGRPNCAEEDYRRCELFGSASVASTVVKIVAQSPQIITSSDYNPPQLSTAEVLRVEQIFSTAKISWNGLTLSSAPLLRASMLCVEKLPSLMVTLPSNATNEIEIQDAESF